MIHPDDHDAMTCRATGCWHRDTATALRELTAEIKAFREAWEKSPQHEINTLMLGNIKAQLGAGILPAGGILKPGH